MRKPRVAILTNLTDFSAAYSLVPIILDQARMLKRAGIPYTLYCCQLFNSEHAARIKTEGLNVKYVLPNTDLQDYPTNQPPLPTKEIDGRVVSGFEEQVKVHLEGDANRGWVGFKDAVKGFDVVITHDLMFLSSFLPMNEAVRKCADLYPEIRWLHWAHSGASRRPEGADLCYPSTLRYTVAPNATHVFLNFGQRVEYAHMLLARPEEIGVVYNPRDAREVLKFSAPTNALIEACGLLDGDLLQTYAFSTPRWRDKGVHKLLKIFGFFKKLGVRGKLCLVNAHCTQKCDEDQVEAMVKYAEGCGLVFGLDYVITSRWTTERAKSRPANCPSWDAPGFWDGCRSGVPNSIVVQLQQISNLFIFPSVSECCSLILAEAEVIGGKLVVLNRDFRPMLEFGDETTPSFEFNRNDPDKNPVFYECVAREIWASVKNNPVIMTTMNARNRMFNRDWIWRQQLEPLIYQGFAAKISGEPEAQEVAEPDPETRDAKVESPTAMIDPDSPYPGMPCEIYGRCSIPQRKKCFAENDGRCRLIKGKGGCVPREGS